MPSKPESYPALQSAAPISDMKILFQPNIPHKQNQSLTYPAVYVIFTLLNVIRRGVERKNIWREFRRQKIALKPRLAFWLAICKEAGLIDDYENQLKVTRHARAWLSKTSEEQTIHLMDAWQNAPLNYKARQFRKKLLWKLKYNQRSSPVDQPLTAKDLGAINGLKALGLWKDGQLTKWGEFFVKGEGKLSTPKPVEPCEIQEDVFIAPLPQHSDLLWEIEKHLRPASPGNYPLTKRALRFHQQDPQILIELIEKGLQAQIPGHTKAILLKQPSIRVAQGIMLEFSDPADLQQLRRQPALRKYIDEFLSSQRVLVSSQNTKALFQMLKRRGVYVNSNEEQPHPSTTLTSSRGSFGRANRKRTHFPQKVLLQPVGKNVPKLEVIEKYKRWQQALDVRYRAPGYPAEQRRITPLSIEQRGEYTYVIAYCQTRRAQRTFRLDRMEVPGTW